MTRGTNRDGSAEDDSPGRRIDEIDARIGELLAEGRIEALALAYDSILPQVRGSLAKWLGSAVSGSELDDVLSSAMLKLWEKRGRFEHGRSVGAWFQTIARNCAIDLLRGRSHLTTDVSEEVILNAVAEVVQDDAKGVNPYRVQLHRAIDELPPTDRTVLDAYLQSGSEHSWATRLSAETGVPAGTLRVRKHRIIQRIRKTLSRINKEVNHV